MDEEIKMYLRSRQLAVVQLMCYVATFIAFQRIRRKKTINRPSRELIQRQKIRDELMYQLSNNDLLEELFAKDRATGEGSETTKEKKRRWASTIGENNMDTISGIDQMVFENAGTLKSFDRDVDDIIDITSTMPSTPSTHVGDQSGSNSKGKKKKTSNVDGCNEADLKAAFFEVANAIREGNVIIGQSQQRVYKEEEIYNELEAMGMEGNVIDDAYSFLLQHPEKVRGLFGIPFQKRRRWLERVMHLG